MSETDKKKLSELEGKGLHIPPPDAEKDPVTNQRPSDEIYSGQGYRKSVTKTEEKQASITKDISILVMITLVAGVLLGAAYGVTKEPIARAQEVAREKAQNMVMDSAAGFEVLYDADSPDAEEMAGLLAGSMQDAGIQTTDVTRIDLAYDKDHAPVGYVITAVDPDGYGGDVELMCGITPSEDGSMTIEGISFLSLSETAGMGMRAKEDSFLNQFSGKRIEKEMKLSYTKNGAAGENEIDAISGCTITTSAVTDDVNAALAAAWQMDQNKQEASE